MNNDIEETVRPPPLWLTLAEGGRLQLELAALLASWSFLKEMPRGDGHPVLVLPGFTGGDGSTLFLRRYLRELGYDARSWGLGDNTGQSHIEPGIFRRINEIVAESDEPFTIIGQSLGGVYAREMGRTLPSHIRQIITLGSPLQTKEGDGSSAMVRRMYERSSRLSIAERNRLGFYSDRGGPPRVPTTAIYSRTDGVVAWPLCMETESVLTENIEVWGSHSGMSMNPLVFYIIADRLAEPLGEWQKLDQAALRRAAGAMWTASIRDAFDLFGFSSALEHS